MDQPPQSKGVNRIPIQVECYSGSRADERPRRVTINEREILITNIIGSSVEESINSKERIHRFKVMTEDGSILKLIKSAGESWYLES